MQTIAEDGVVVYDATDDAEVIPGSDSKGEIMELADYYLQQTPGLFSDEYMHRFEQESDAAIARAKRIDRLVSAGVIFGIILFVSLLCWIFF